MSGEGVGGPPARWAPFPLPRGVSPGIGGILFMARGGGLGKKVTPFPPERGRGMVTRKDVSLGKKFHPFFSIIYSIAAFLGGKNTPKSFLI